MEINKIISEGLNFFHVRCNKKTLDNLCFYALELRKWNGHINLTGLKGLDRIVSELVYDAFFLHEYIQGMDTVVDLGSGSGIIAIPLAILNEHTKIVSIDKSLKKIQFQSHIKRSLHLTGFNAVHGRAEVLDAVDADVLIAKGFGNINIILEKGGRHIRTGGYAFLLKGKNETPVIYDGFDLNHVVPYTLPVSEKKYQLFVYRKL